MRIIGSDPSSRTIGVGCSSGVVVMEDLFLDFVHHLRGLEGYKGKDIRIRIRRSKSMYERKA